MNNKRKMKKKNQKKKMKSRRENWSFLGVGTSGRAQEKEE
jgi:hypothetical protein